MNEIESKLLNKIKTGNAILFTGAGFSQDHLNILEEAPPVASELSCRLCDFAKIRKSNNLQYVANKCIDKNCSELIENLKKWYTLKEISEDTVAILSVKWRRLYTTNYDTGLEQGLAKNGKPHQSLCADSDFNKNVNGENLCIHINGLIETLDEEQLEKDFKLSSSSYVASALDSVTKNKWCSFFKRDLENASAIVFVGYSLYDFEIEKLLFENDSFKRKTYFICKSDIFDEENEEFRYRLSQYGQVLNFEKKGLAQLILVHKADFLKSKIVLTDFIEFSDSFRLSEDAVKDDLATDSLIFGTNSQKLAVNAVYTSDEENRPRFFVKRTESIVAAIEQLETGKHVFISTECGNGKTCLLYQIAAQLNLNSEKVYFLSDGYRGDHDQLFEISRGSDIKYIVVDNCSFKIDFLKVLLGTPYKTVRLICADRTARLAVLFDQLKKEGLDKNCNLLSDFDLFSEKETTAFLFLIDFLGQWRNLAGRGSVEKIRWLEGEENRIRLAPALLKLLNAKQIKDRLSDILKKVVNKNSERKKTVFVMCYLSITGTLLDDSNISEVSDCNEIYSVPFVGGLEFTQLFRKNGTTYFVPYSFAQYVLRGSGFFTGIEIRDYLLDIINRLGNKNVLPELVRDALRFHVIESIVPDVEKKIVMQDYYEQLKGLEAFGHRLINDPNYWMQYAMTKMMCYNYDEAQTYLEQAYGKAEYLRKYTINKDGIYNTNKIDNQQARLYLLRAKDKKCLDSTSIYDYFMKAESKLHNAPLDIFRARRIDDMVSVFQEKSIRLSKKHFSAIQENLTQYRDELKNASSMEAYTNSRLFFTRLAQKIDLLL